MEDLFDEEIGASKEPQAKKARPPTSTAKSLGDSSEVRAKQKRFTLTLKDRYAAKRQVWVALSAVAKIPMQIGWSPRRRCSGVITQPLAT
jgi:transposase